MKNRKVLFWLGLAAAAAIVFLLAPHASSRPDGLERVALDHGFSGQEKQAGWTSPLAGYSWSGLRAENWAVRLSGLAGAALTFGAVMLLFRSLGRRRNGRGK